jgi:uncharacterized protein YutE (UPF0331/DUF86 family)
MIEASGPGHRSLLRAKGSPTFSEVGLHEQSRIQGTAKIRIADLERAVQTCVDIAAHVISQTELPVPSTMGEGFERLAELRIISPQVATSLQKAVAFRNILVHNYTNINWDIVANILTSHLTDFVQFAQAIDRLNNDNDQKP